MRDVQGNHNLQRRLCRLCQSARTVLMPNFCVHFVLIRQKMQSRQTEQGCAINTLLIGLGEVEQGCQDRWVLQGRCSGMTPIFTSL